MRVFVKSICVGLLLCLLPPSALAYQSLTYLYAGNTSIYLNNIDRTQGSLTTICPDFFEINADGSLKLTAKLDAKLVSGLHERGLKVTPYLSNHWDRALGRAALTNRVSLATQLAQAVKNYDLDGVDIDIENINENDRSSFTEFIRVLRGTLPQNKTVTVCVAANPSGWTTGWHGAYDYAALGELADHVFLMTYDESYSGGPEGPVASLSFVEKSIQYALKRIPSKKVMVGIPFYGRYWKEGSTTGGAALTVADIEGLCANHAAETWYSAEHDSARAKLTITAAEVSQGLWGGKKLSAGVYSIWYENLQSWMKKMTLVRKYDLLGVGSWALGQEPTSLWSNYRIYLQGAPFEDVYGHWALEHIAALYESGIVNGTSPRLFSPEKILTRAESVVMVCRAMGLPQAGTNEASYFPDIKGHWAEGYLNALGALGVLRGFSDGLCHPDAPMTREQLAVFLERLCHLPNTIDFNQSFFPDVSPGETDWSNNAIVTLTIHGVLDGYNDGLFHPKLPVTRAQAAKIVSRWNALPHKLPTVETMILQELPDIVKTREEQR